MNGSIWMIHEVVTRKVTGGGDQNFEFLISSLVVVVLYIF